MLPILFLSRASYHSANSLFLIHHISQSYSIFCDTLENIFLN